MSTEMQHVNCVRHTGGFIHTYKAFLKRSVFKRSLSYPAPGPQPSYLALGPWPPAPGPHKHLTSSN